MIPGADEGPLDAILAGRFVDPETGTRFSPSTRVCIAASLEGAEGELVRELRLGRSIAVVADETTWDALGARVARMLQPSVIVVLRRPHADLHSVEEVRRQAARAEALVAVGSGTINDLCKVAAHKDHRRYAVFATAPSMNGYVTATASLAVRGLRISAPARPPVAAFFDLGILASAPVRLRRAGIGDCLARTTAQFDWLLSHLLFETPYSETPFAIQADSEAELLERAAAVVDGEVAAVEVLTRTLLLSGYGMALVGSSHPASMGEHLISHFIDTQAMPHPGCLHGEQVGVAVWSMARLQARLVAGAEPPRLEPTPLDEEALRSRFGPAGEDCVKAVRRKALDAVTAERLNSRLATDWPRMRARLRGAALPLARLERAMRDGGLPMTGSDLGLPAGTYGDAVRYAHQTRDRYGALDLAEDSGILEGFAAGEA